jgi:hypothetical protein
MENNADKEKTKISKAQIADVKFGKRIIQGLMLPSGEFAIAVPQTIILLPNLATPNNATKAVKRLLGISNSLLQIKSEINATPVNYISLVELERLVVLATAKGDKDALSLNLDLVGLSLTQLWSDAFGVKFEQKERTQWLEDRDEHRREFHKRLTPFWQLDGCDSGIDYAKRVIEFKAYSGLPTDISVSDYDSKQLRRMNEAETIYCTLRKANFSHQDAISRL